jgi:UPF0716 protein FxsA
MVPWLIFFALVAFPVAEALSIMWLAGHIGWWALAWLVAAFFGGLALIRLERLAFAPRMLFSMQRGESPFRALFASTRLFIAGGLLMFPGLVTDAMALGLLLYPGTWKTPHPGPLPQGERGTQSAQGAGRFDDEIIEGEFRRESEPDDPFKAPSGSFPRRDS